MPFQHALNTVPVVDTDGTGFGHYTVVESILAAQTVLNQASAAQTAGGNSADLTVGQYRELAVDINISAVSGTSPSATFFVDRKGADGIYYNIYSSGAKTTTGTVSTSIGAGGAATNSAFGNVIRFRWTITGTTPSFTFSASIIGK